MLHGDWDGNNVDTRLARPPRKVPVITDSQPHLPTNTLSTYSAQDGATEHSGVHLKRICSLTGKNDTYTRIPTGKIKEYALATE